MYVFYKKIYIFFFYDITILRYRVCETVLCFSLILGLLVNCENWGWGLGLEISIVHSFKNNVLLNVFECLT